MQQLTRRQMLALGSGAAVITMLPVAPILAAGSEFEMRVKKFAGTAMIREGGIELDLPEIAENGNTVPMSVSVGSPMTKADHVQQVMVLAEGNPLPGVITFNFSHMSGSAEASTRMRLAKTQNVVAVARMSDGSVRMVKSVVKVTIGGCGG